jgi:hypothetical protein
MMTESANKAIWKVDSNVRFRRLFDEAVLIQQETAEALVLNETAISFLEACDGKRTVNEIISGMVEDFQVSAEDLAADLGTFIQQLEQEGIIKAVP